MPEIYEKLHQQVLKNNVPAYTWIFPLAFPQICIFCILTKLQFYQIKVPYIPEYFSLANTVLIFHRQASPAYPVYRLHRPESRSFLALLLLLRDTYIRESNILRSLFRKIDRARICECAISRSVGWTCSTHIRCWKIEKYGRDLRCA